MVRISPLGIYVSGNMRLFNGCMHHCNTFFGRCMRSLCCNFWISPTLQALKYATVHLKYVAYGSLIVLSFMIVNLPVTGERFSFTTTTSKPLIRVIAGENAIPFSAIWIGPIIQSIGGALDSASHHSVNSTTRSSLSTSSGN